MKKKIKLTEHELQSNANRQKHAEGLISQLPKDHNGRNTWLLNYGTGEEAVKMRKDRGLKHVLYCMLCFRFNEAQRFVYVQFGNKYHCTIKILET
jgi:hypothetical protein